MTRKVLFSSVGAFFIFAAVYFSFSALNDKSIAQTLAPAQNLTTNQPTRARAVETVKSVAVNAGFASALSRNADLRQNMDWTFGGKAQRGWSLYEPLICQLLNVETADGDEFATNLARWQKTEGLAANGILDDAALAAIIKKWQANRLKMSGYPSPEELTTAPASDFWDASRAAELRQVERETYAAYKKMVAAAIADESLNLTTDGNGNLAASEKFLKIVSAFRSREYQTKLRQASPNSGRAGLAVNSPHFTGRALDIYVGGEPVTTRDDNRAVQVKTPVYKWLVKNAAKFGFKPYFYEPWHWEYSPDAVATTAK